jgi:N-acyl-D-aspartate/D-glutamate deacylase
MSSGHDIVLRGVTIFDGSGDAPIEGDLAIEGDRIAALGAVPSSAPVEIDARGLAVAPGFIDVHTHDDFAAIAHPEMTFKLAGGVTTCVVGNCGFGAAPFAEACHFAKSMHPRLEISAYEGYRGYMEQLEAVAPGVNVAALAGHGTLRMAVMGNADREPADREMTAMKALLGEALEAGVLGMSSGLIYEPGRYARTDELVELAREMRAVGGLYATHMRDEGQGLIDSVREAIEIGRRAKVGVQISHHKASGRENWGLVNQSIELIEMAQARGEQVHADQYPYTAGSTILRAVIQNGAFDESAEAIPGGIGRVRAEDVLIASAAGHTEWEGQSVAALAAGMGLSPRACADRIAALSPGATVVLHMMSEADVRTVMVHPSTMIGSDGIPTLEGKPHPRLSNTFARVIGHYARDLGLYSMSEAIYRMTGFPAQKFGLGSRGLLREGYYADVVVFDPRRIIDQGTYEAPDKLPLGIQHVFVNGRAAIDGTLATGERPGCVIRAQSPALAS